MKNDLENTINALEDLELERLYLKKLINEYITLKNNHKILSGKDINQELITLNKYLHKVQELIDNYGKETITLNLYDLLSIISSNDNFTKKLPSIFVNVIESQNSQNNTFEKLMKNLIKNNFNFDNYEFEDSIINLNPFYNQEIYNIFNVLCAKIDISPKTNLDFQSDISKQVEIIFHHNENDNVLVQQLNLEDINITFDIKQLITINKDIKQAIINCLKNQTINNGTKILIK
ncbi:MAG: hypothetical protein MR765_02215 [Tenericutes bacterium]|nr:hypothetical protein [Mycoplasmatota bacterium]